MDLVIYQMMQLQIVHVSNSYGAVKIFSGTAVAETHFTVAGNGNALPQRSVSLVLIKILHNVRRQDILVFRAELLKIFSIYIIVRQLKGILDIFLVGAVEYRSGNIESQRLCRKTEMDLKHLSDIHTGGHAQRIQHDIQGTAVRQERHIFNRKHTGYDTLVSMTACHFVAYRNLTFLRNINTYRLVYAGSQLVAVLSCKHFGVNDNTIFSVRNLKRSVSYLSGLLAEDRTEQTFLRCKLGLSLGRYLTHQDIACAHFRADTDDTTLIQVFQCVVAHARNISGDLFRSQLGISGLCLVLLHMDGSIYIVLDKSFT